MKRQFATSLAWAAAGNWSREIINIFVFLTLARLLGPRAYGVMGMVGVATAIADALLNNGLGNYIVREKRLEPAHIDAVFWIQLAVASVLSLAMVVGAPVLAAIYQEPDVARILPVTAALPLLFALSSVPSAVLQRTMSFRPLTIRSFAAAAAGGVVGVGLALTGGGVWSLVYMALTQWSVTCLILWTAADWRPGFAVERRHVLDVMRFGSHAVGVKLLIILDQQLPRFIIAATLGAVSLGFFTIAWRIVEVVGLLTLTPIAQVTLPTLGALQDDRTRLRAGVAAIVGLTFAISLPCYVGLAAIAPVLMPVMSGHGWDGAVPVLQLFSLYGIASGLVVSLDSVMLATGRMVWRTQFTVFGVGLLAIGLAVAYPYGLTAMATTMVAREFISGIIIAVALGRYGLAEGLEVLGRITPFVLAAAIMLAAVLSWQHFLGVALNGPALLASSIAAGTVVYGIGVFAFARNSTMQIVELGLSRYRRKAVS
jgi:O-antigen/teichoic acid export membrane protein